MRTEEVEVKWHTIAITADTKSPVEAHPGGWCRWSEESLGALDQERLLHPAKEQSGALCPQRLIVLL